MNALDAALQQIVTRFEAVAISAPIALMEMLLRSSDAEAVARSLPTLGCSQATLTRLTALAAEHQAGCRTIAAMLRRGLVSNEPPSAELDGIERARVLFDDSVAQNEEASVALYSLGSPELLAECTAEAVAVLERWGVLGAQRDALDLGCGIGRFLRPLSPRLRSLVGVDVSSGMVASAATRAVAAANVRVQSTSGQGPRGLPGCVVRPGLQHRCVSLHRAGRRGARAPHFEEIARVLRPGGDFVIFSYAYQRATAVDAADVAAHAHAAGLTVVRTDETPFRLWGAVGHYVHKS